MPWQNRIGEEEKSLVFVPYGLFPEELGDGWFAMWPCTSSKITLVNLGGILFIFPSPGDSLWKELKRAGDKIFLRVKRICNLGCQRGVVGSRL